MYGYCELRTVEAIFDRLEPEKDGKRIEEVGGSGRRLTSSRSLLGELCVKWGILQRIYLLSNVNIVSNGSYREIGFFTEMFRLRKR